MKKKYYYLMIASMALSSATLASCNDDDDDMTPTVDLKTLNFTHEPGEGQITLRWTAPANAEEAGFMYMKMTYTDPRDKKTRVKTLSPFSNEIVIPNTRARYGDTYSFTFVPYSETDTPGIPLVLDKCRSMPAAATVSIERIKIKVGIDQLYTNALEPSEGSLEALTDGDTGNFFHTIWSTDKPEYAYVDIDLGREVDRLEIHSWNRATANGFPTTVSWSRLSKLQDENVHVIDDALVTYEHTPGSGVEFSYMYPAENEPPMSIPVRYLRYCGNIAQKQSFWHMAEMEFNEIIVHRFDPETDEKEVVIE